MSSRYRRFRIGASAGVVSAIAYVLEQAIDLRAFDHNTDDLILLGRLVTNNEQRVRWVGLGMHLANGVVVGSFYATVVHDRLPGPPIARSLTFLTAETVSLYLLAMLEERHPAVREGRIDRYWNRTGFVQQVLRHVAFGIVLGPLTARSLSRTR